MKYIYEKVYRKIAYYKKMYTNIIQKFSKDNILVEDMKCYFYINRANMIFAYILMYRIFVFQKK